MRAVVAERFHRVCRVVCSPLACRLPTVDRELKINTLDNLCNVFSWPWLEYGSGSFLASFGVG